MWNSLLDGMGHVLAFFYAGVSSYGVAIIGLTVVVRLLLFPLTAKQARSMQKMQLIQPEIKKIQAKYKNDRQKLNEEIMKFYKENQVNPLAGCLPLLLQMPIFFALFAVLRNPHKHVPQGSELYSAFCGSTPPASCEPKGLRFLGMDLSEAATAAHDGFIDALPYFILIGLVVITGYLQFKQTQSRQTQSNPQMAMMGKIFPVMFAFISLNLPSGVVLYFLVSNSWQIGQQAVIFKHVVSATPTLSAPVDGAKSATKDPEEPKARAPEEKREAPKPAPRRPEGQATSRDGLGRAQPSGSRPRPRKRRR